MTPKTGGNTNQPAYGAKLCPSNDPVDGKPRHGDAGCGGGKAGKENREVFEMRKKSGI